MHQDYPMYPDQQFPTEDSPDMTGSSTDPAWLEPGVKPESSARSKVVGFNLGGALLYFNLNPQLQRRNGGDEGAQTIVDRPHSQRTQEIGGGAMGQIIEVFAAEDGSRQELVVKIPRVSQGFTLREIEQLFVPNEHWTETELIEAVTNFSWNGTGRSLSWLGNLAEMCRQSQINSQSNLSMDQRETGIEANKRMLNNLGHLINEASILNIISQEHSLGPVPVASLIDLQFFELEGNNGEKTYVPFIVMERIDESSNTLSKLFVDQIIKIKSLEDQAANIAAGVALSESAANYLRISELLAGLAESMVYITGRVSIEEDGRPYYLPRIVIADLKPGHIIVDEEGKVRIVDFGLSLSLRKTDSLQAERPGEKMYYDAPWISNAMTHRYAPPERFLRGSKYLDMQNYPEKQDPYAIAKIMCELLSAGRKGIYITTMINPNQVDEAVFDIVDTDPTSLADLAEGSGYQVTVAVNEIFVSSLMDNFRLQEQEAKVVADFINRYLDPNPATRAAHPAILPLLVGELIKSVALSTASNAIDFVKPQDILDLMRLAIGCYKGGSYDSATHQKLLKSVTAKYSSYISNSIYEIAYRVIERGDKDTSKKTINALLVFLYNEGLNSSASRQVMGVGGVTLDKIDGFVDTDTDGLSNQFPAVIYPSDDTSLSGDSPTDGEP